MNAKFAVLAITAFAGVAAATDCASDELVKLAGLASNPHVSTCSTASGWSMLPPSGYPTVDQNAKMCATSDCHSLIKDIIKLNPSNCMLSFGSVSLNVFELASGFEASCSSSSSSSSSASASAPAPSTTTTPAPSTTTATPSVTMATPWGTDTPSMTPAATPTTPSYC